MRTLDLFQIKLFHVDRTAKKGYNSYIISFQEKSFGSSPGLFQGFFYMIWSVAQFGRSIWPGTGRLHVRIIPSQIIRLNLPFTISNKLYSLT